MPSFQTSSLEFSSGDDSQNTRWQRSRPLPIAYADERPEGTVTPDAPVAAVPPASTVSAAFTSADAPENFSLPVEAPYHTFAASVFIAERMRDVAAAVSAASRPRTSASNAALSRWTRPARMPRLKVSRR